MPMSGADCIHHDDLQAYLLGELPERVAQAISRHLETCPTCDTLAQALDDHLDPFASALRHTVRPSSPTPLPATLVGSLPGETAPAFVSRTVAGYTILGELGRGGMGVVYKARQSLPERLVALKMILAGSHAAAERRARFLAEADAIARLQHPNIIQVYEVGKENEAPFLALEYVGGGNLAQKVAGIPQPPGQSAALVETLARAIDHAHEQGVLHRDLKPANVLLTTDGVPKIGDFGLAKHEKTDLTATGVLVGTPSYMAPEQASGAGTTIGPAVDVYALGAILYEMLTGRPPFQGATALDTLDQVCHQDPVPPARLQPKLPRDLETICLKCLEKEPGRRYASAEALADDLQRFQQGRPVLARPLGRIGRTWRWCRRNPGWAAMLTLVGSLVTIMVVGATLLTLRALTAEARTREQLFESRLAEAQALSLSHRPGQHFASLDRLDQAAELAGSLQLPADRVLDLRNAAVAALARPDMYPESSWPGFPAGSVAVDFDGRLQTYARVDRDGSCHVCRSGTGEELYHLPAPGIATQPPLTPSLRMSQDGRFVAVLHGSEEAQVWQLGPPQPQLVLREYHVHWVDFRDDCQQVAFSHIGGAISIYDLTTHHRIHQLPPDHLLREVVVTLHPREPLVAVASHFARVVQVRDVRTTRVLASWPVRDANHVTWDPSGDRLVVVCFDHTHVFNRATLKKEATWPTGGVRAAMSPTGETIATHDYGTGIQVADCANGQCLFSFHTANPTPLLHFDPTGHRLAGFVKHNTLGIWRLADGKVYRTLPQEALHPHSPWQLAVAIDCDGRLLAATSAEGVVFWDLATGRRLGFLPMNRPSQVAFTGGTQRALLTVGLFSGVLRWPIHTDTAAPGVCHIGPPEPWPLPPGSWLAQSTNGSVFATAARATLRTEAWAGFWLWHPGESKTPAHLEPGKDEGPLTISPDGRWLVSSTWSEGPVTLWDARTGKRQARLVDFGFQPCFSPDGRWLAVPGQSGSLFAVGTWQKVRPLYHPCLFGPDGVTAVEATDEPHVLRLVETVTGRELVRLEEPSLERNTPLAFTPDGTRLITGFVAQAIRVWDLRLMREELKQRKLDWDMPSYAAPLTSAAPIQLRLERGNCDQLSEQLAAQAYDRGIEAAPQLAVRWYCRGLYYWGKAQQQKACRDLAQAVKLAPSVPVFCNDLSWFYQTGPDRTRHAAEAVALAERAVAGAPGEWAYQNTLGMAYYHAGRYRDGIATLEQSLRGSAGTQDGYDLYGLALCHAKLGDLDRARACLADGFAWAEVQVDLPAAEITELTALRNRAEKVIRQAEQQQRTGHAHGSAPPRKPPSH